MLKRYVEQILNLYNYVDGLVVTDEKGYVVYVMTYRPDINSLDEKETVGKHILDLYPELNEENSSIMRVLRSGKPIYNEFQELTSHKGQLIHVVNTTMPIIIDGKVAGAIDVTRYVDSDYERKNISISLNDRGEEKLLYDLDDIITRSPEMDIVKKKIPLVAETDSSVLIYGETGTGKELVAQSIHSCSSRRNKRFVSQNCAAIPSNLLESILFGTTKGSYTGAENKPGLFEIANGGTIFLDEINSMELNIQSKILKAIEEKQVTRLGRYDPIKIDVKIVSAMNMDPQQCVAEKRIREDLFYRLSVVQLNLPPLRQRRVDIPYLTDFFIKYYNKKMNKDILSVDEEVEKLFMTHEWKGNVRELKNVIEGAFNISSSRILRKRDFPEYLARPARADREKFPSMSSEGGHIMPEPEEHQHLAPMGENLVFDENMALDEMVEGFEKSIIENTLKTTRSVSEAARKLKLSRQALQYKMTKYHL